MRAVLEPKKSLYFCKYDPDPTCKSGLGGQLKTYYWQGQTPLFEVA
jgi:hypothetical protein